MEHRRVWSHPGHLAVPALLALLGCSNLIVLVSMQRGLAAGTHFDVPLPTGTALHVHIGERARWRTTTPSGALNARGPATRYMRVGIFHRSGPGWSGQRLLSMALPAWSLPVFSLFVCGTALAGSAWLRARHR